MACAVVEWGGIKQREMLQKMMKMKIKYCKREYNFGKMKKCDYTEVLIDAKKKRKSRKNLIPARQIARYHCV